MIKHLQAPFADGAKPSLLSDDEMLHPYLPDDALLDALSYETWGDEVSQCIACVATHWPQKGPKRPFGNWRSR